MLHAVTVVLQRPINNVCDEKIANRMPVGQKTPRPALPRFRRPGCRFLDSLCHLLAQAIQNLLEFLHRSTPPPFSSHSRLLLRRCLLLFFLSQVCRQGLADNGGNLRIPAFSKLAPGYFSHRHSISFRRQRGRHLDKAALLAMRRIYVYRKYVSRKFVFRINAFMLFGHFPRQRLQTIAFLTHFSTLSTALASASNSSAAREVRANSLTVNPVSAASATAARCPTGGSNCSPSSCNEPSSSRPSRVLTTLDGTSRTMGFPSPRSFWACRARSMASRTAMMSRDDGPAGRSTRSASNPASRAGSVKPGGVSIRTRSASCAAACTALRNCAAWPASTALTSVAKTPSPSPAHATKLPCGSASNTTTDRPMATISAAKFAVIVLFPMPPLRPVTAIIAMPATR